MVIEIFFSCSVLVLGIFGFLSGVWGKKEYGPNWASVVFRSVGLSYLEKIVCLLCLGAEKGWELEIFGVLFGVQGMRTSIEQQTLSI